MSHIGHSTNTELLAPSSHFEDSLKFEIDNRFCFRAFDSILSSSCSSDQFPFSYLQIREGRDDSFIFPETEGIAPAF